MPKSIFIIFLLLLITAARTSAETPDGKIPFDCPDTPDATFQFHFTHELIALAATTVPFNTVKNIYFRVYNYEVGVFDKLVAYYTENLKAKNWHALREDSGDLLLYVLEETGVQKPRADNTLAGIFAVVKGKEDIYLLNIVGSIPSQQMRKLLANLDELGIDVPELKSLGELALPKSEEIAAPMLTLFRTAGNPAVAKGQIHVSFSSSYEENHQGHWTYRGHPIERIEIRADELKQVATISDGLKSGAKDITELLDNQLSKNRSVDAPKFIVHAAERRITITAGKLLDETQPTMLTKLFRTREGDPIHEIVIRGNRRTETNTFRDAFEQGTEEVESVIEALPNAVPTLEKVELLIEEKDSQRTAIITVVEKPLASRFYFQGSPRLGFNRVTGWEVGARIESGFRQQEANESSFRFGFSPESRRNDTPKFFFGQVGYGFGDKQPYYQVGGEAVWSEPYSWDLGLTAQFHRTTSIIAPDLFSHYVDTPTTILRVVGVPDHQNYYLREGIEVALQWKAVLRKHPSTLMLPNHFFKLILLAESHDSLEKSTDWYLFNWGTKSEVRDNPAITPGRMHSAMFRYDFDTRNDYLGWHNTFFVEHSNPTFGSDFEWTRFQTHLRYAYPLGGNQIRGRVVVGSATAPLPIQRQFVMGGIGTLNGYPLYAFTGDAGFLLNMEFIYRLFSFGSQSFSAALILDGGQAWNRSEDQWHFDPKGSVGIGLQYETDVEVFRFNVAKAFDSEQGIQFNFLFFYSF